MTRRAAAKMPVWMICRRVAAAASISSGGSGGEEVMEEAEAEALRRATESSRRMATHSLALRLLCWKRSMRGVERRREVYCRWSWDLRSSGGL